MNTYMSLMRLQIVIQVRYRGAGRGHLRTPSWALEEDYKLWQNAATV